MGDLTTGQKRLINVAEAAEVYLQEQQFDDHGGGWGSYSDARKRSHEQDINRRLRQMDVSKN